MGRKAVEKDTWGIYVSSQKEWDEIPKGVPNTVYIASGSGKCINIVSSKDNEVVVVGGSFVNLYCDSHVFVVDSIATLYDNSSAVAIGESQIYLKNKSEAIVHGKTRAEAHDSSFVFAYDSAVVILHGDTQAEVRGSVSVYASDYSKVLAYGYSVVEAGKDAQVSAYDCSTVGVRGSVKVRAFDYVKVEAWGNCLVEGFDSSKLTINRGGFVHLKDRSRVDLKEGSNARVYVYEGTSNVFCTSTGAEIIEVPSKEV